jgi:molecular chaperone IbpA
MKRSNLFDSIPNLFPSAESMLTAMHEVADKFPFFNIFHDKEKDSVLIEIAVAGFGKQDLEVLNDNGVLVINGRKATEGMPSGYQQLVAVYRNIALRNFTRKFIIGLDYEVGKVSLKDGILKILINRIVPSKKSSITIED